MHVNPPQFKPVKGLVVKISPVDNSELNSHSNDKGFRGLYIGLNFFVTFFVHPKKVKKKNYELIIVL
jgi:hypothetical protein